MKKTILYIIVLFGISCQPKIEEANIVKYFDTELFVEKEIKSLSQMNLIAKKEISLNGQIETIKDIKVDSSFLYQEFQLFRVSNINKPALLGKYLVDSSWSVGPIVLEDELSLLYSLKDSSKSKLITRELFVYPNWSAKDRPSLLIEMMSNNFMHSYRKECHYENKNFISIKAWEKTLFQDTLFYETKLIFIKN